MAVERLFYVRDQHVFGYRHDAASVSRLSLPFFSRVRTRANLYLALHHVAGHHYSWLPVLRQCFSTGAAADGHTTYKARPSTTLTNNYHVRPRLTDFITFWP